MVKRLLIGLSSLVVAMVLFVNVAEAARLENSYISLSNPIQSEPGVTYTIRFTHASSDLGAVRFTFCNNASGTCGAPSNLAVSGYTEVAVTDPNGDIDEWFPGNTGENIIHTTRGGPDGVEDAASGLTYTFAFGAITNPDSTACDEPVGDTSTTTCYLRIQTYSDSNGGTQADNATVTFTLTQAVTVSATVDPSFTLIISGMDPNETAAANGTTLSITSSVTTIPFGNLTPGTPKFGGQSATVNTNASQGYTITARMVANMTGSAYGDDIDPFSDGGAAVVNTTDESWASPTGTASGVDSGWLGIGTDDAEYAPANNNEFFPLNSSTAQTVSQQTSSAQSEIDIYSFGIEVNSYQQADSYTGTLRYNALPTF